MWNICAAGIPIGRFRASASTGESDTPQPIAIPEPGVAELAAALIGGGRGIDVAAGGRNVRM